MIQDFRKKWVATVKNRLDLFFRKWQMGSDIIIGAAQTNLFRLQSKIFLIDTNISKHFQAQAFRTLTNALNGLMPGSFTSLNYKIARM